MAKEKLLADLFGSGKNGKDGSVAELKAAFKHLAETEGQIERLARNALGLCRLNQEITYSLFVGAVLREGT